jgi:hypothetical protein
MDSKTISYIKSRCRELSKRDGYVLDVTNMDLQGRGGNIIHRSRARGVYIISDNYSIVSMDVSNYFMVNKIMDKSPIITLNDIEIVSDEFVDCIIHLNYTGAPRNIKNISRFYMLSSIRHNNNAGTLLIGESSKFGYFEAVKFLSKLEGVDPASDNNYPLRIASSKGYTPIVKFLSELEGVDPSVDNNYPIRIASSNGSTPIVKFLLELEGVDPSVDNNYPLRIARSKGYTDIIIILLDHFSATLHSYGTLINPLNGSVSTIMTFVMNIFSSNTGIESGEVKYSNIESDKECQVCYSETINIKYNSCNHELCKDCMDRWRITNTTCPFCRTRVI